MPQHVPPILDYLNAIQGTCTLIMRILATGSSERVSLLSQLQNFDAGISQLNAQAIAATQQMASHLGSHWIECLKNLQEKCGFLFPSTRIVTGWELKHAEICEAIKQMHTVESGPDGIQTTRYNVSVEFWQMAQNQRMAVEKEIEHRREALAQCVNACDEEVKRAIAEWNALETASKTPPPPKNETPAIDTPDGPTMEGFFYVAGKPYKFADLQWRLLKALWKNGSVSAETIGDEVYKGEDAIDGRLRKLVSDTNDKLLKHKLRFEITSPMASHYILQELPPVTPGVTEK
jgi:hypothetical protein